MREKDGKGQERRGEEKKVGREGEISVIGLRGTDAPGRNPVLKLLAVQVYEWRIERNGSAGFGGSKHDVDNGRSA